MTAPTRNPRTLGGVCVGLAASAALLWGTSALTWYAVRAAVPGRGEQVVTFVGGQVTPLLAGVALLALAGVAAVVATAGMARRLIGVLLALAGGAVATVALLGAAAAPFATDRPAAALPQVPPGASGGTDAGGTDTGALRGQPTDITAAPLLGVAGGVLLLATGVVVLVREPRLPRFGARYAAPGQRRVEVDPDRAAWQDLDAGRDPTADPPRDAGDDVLRQPPTGPS